MPRKSKSNDNFRNNGDKPGWMVAAEERLNAAEAEKGTKGTEKLKTKSENKSKYSSRLSSAIKTNEKNNIENEVSSNKPGWMLAAENRLKEEEAGKESKRKLKKSSSNKSKTDGNDSQERDISNNNNNNDFLTLPPEIDNIITKTISSVLLPKEEEEKIDREHRDEIKRLHNQIKTKQLEYEEKENDGHIDTSMNDYDIELNKIDKESELREKKFLELIEATKLRMRESCEIASVNREQYVNTRSQVPQFFTTALCDENDKDDDDDGDDNDGDDNDHMEDYWGIESNIISKKGNNTTSFKKSNKSFEEMKLDFFKNCDRLVNEVNDAKQEHIKTLGEIHALNINSIKDK